MKIKQLLLGGVLLASAGGAVPASAETVDNYLETFDNVTVIPEKSCDIKYWTHLQLNNYTWNLPTYQNPQEGGHTDGYLRAQYNGYAYSILVSPQVFGDVTFWAKAYSTGVSFIVYNMTKNADGSFTRGDQILNLNANNSDPVLSTTEWKQITVPCGDDGKYLGFMMSYGELDDFSAPKANLEDKKSLKLTDVRMPYGAMPADLDETNTITFTATVDLTNNGTVDLAPSDYKLEVYAGGYSDLGVKVAEAEATSAIAASASSSEEVTFTMDLSELTDFSKTYYIYVKESLTDTYKQMTSPNSETGTYYYNFSIKFIPYLPSPAVWTTGSKAMANGPQMGQIEAGKEGTLVVNIANTAAKAPMTVTAIEVDGGFTVDGSTSFTVAAGETHPVTVKFKSDETGLHSGKFVVKTAEVGDLERTVKAMVIPAGAHVFTFDTDAPGFILGKDWSLVEVPEVIAKGEGDKALTQDGYSTTEVITPKLHFNAGDKLYFELASRTGSGEMNVYTSTDRVNWSERVLLVDRYSTEGTEGKAKINLDQADATYYYFGSYCADMPEGDVYVKFNGYGVRLDNVAGGEVVDVPFDLYVTGTEIPAKGTVNYNLYSTLSVRNLGNDLAADAYTAELVFNGETVATAESVAMEQGESTVFEFDYTPHAAGEATAFFRIKVGESEICTPEATVTINPETSGDTYQIGKKNDYWYQFPIMALAYDPYQSETILPAEALTDLKNGDNIVQIGFMGKYYTAEYTSLNAKVYVQNTDAVKAPTVNDGFTSTDDMTLVLDGQITFDTSLKEYGEYAKIVFDTPFKYTGEGLRITVVVSDLTSEVEGLTGTANWGTTSQYGNYQILYRGSYGLQQQQMPVTYIHTSQPVPVVAGKVTDAENNKAVAGAKVALTSGEVLYEAETAEDGTYELNVFQYSLPYEFTVSAAGYVPYTAEEEVAVAEEGMTLNAAINKIKVSVSGTLKLRGEALEGATVGLTPATNEGEGDNEGDDQTEEPAESAEPAAQADEADEADETAEPDPLFTVTDENGSFTIANLLPGDSFILTVYSDEAAPYTQEFTLTEEDLDLGEITLTPAYCNISGQVMDAGAPMTGVKVTLTAEEGEPLEATTDAEGKFLIKTTAINTLHTLAIEHPEYLSFSQQVEVAEDHIDLGTLVLTSGLEGLESDTTFTAKGLTGEIAIFSAAPCQVRIFTAAGVLVKSLSDFSGSATVSGLTAGLYIVNNVKVIVK